MKTKWSNECVKKFAEVADDLLGRKKKRLEVKGATWYLTYKEKDASSCENYKSFKLWAWHVSDWKDIWEVTDKRGNVR